ncbi:MAG: GntR family transcriptional regulator [Acetobacteraceae bacterium]|nr:GntR family transcriptional regulator [Acetobacteraceae bacterium]
MDTSIEAKADLSRSSVARYIQLATLFRRRIDSGQWAAGTQIPTVDDLSAQYGVARATIRQALGLLEAEGLITRHRAKGTFVSERVRQHLWLDMTTDWRGLMNARDGALIEVLENEEVHHLPHRLHELGTPAERYRRLRRRHSRDGQVFLIADVFVEAEFYQLIPKEAFTSTTAMRLTTFLPKVRHAQQTITIGTADLETAALLDVPLNAPLCLVDRLVTDHRDRLVLLSKGIYRGDLVRMDMRLK